MVRPNNNLNLTLKYLKSGKQTKITLQIQQIADNFSGDAMEKSRQIINYFDQRMRLTNFDEKLFRKRTADQIITDGFLTGCTDAAIVFVAVARACNIPAKYVETIDLSWLKEGGNQIRGHQYVEIYDEDGDRWIWIDPLGRRVDIASPDNEGRIIFKEGLDSWDIGITDFDSLSKSFDTFRENWIKK